MSDSEVITATEASRAFSDVLHKVAYQGQSFVIKKGSRLMARIVPVDEPVAVSTPASKKSAAKKTLEKPAEVSAPKTAEKPAPARTPPVPRSGVSPVPEGLTSEDVDFYKNLIATMGQSS